MNVSPHIAEWWSYFWFRLLLPWVSGSVGGLFAIWGYKFYKEPALITDPDIIGSAIGAAIPVIVAFIVADVERRRSRTYEIGQALRSVRALRDAVDLLADAQGAVAWEAWEQVEAAALRLDDAAEGETDVYLRIAIEDAKDLFVKEHSNLRFAARVTAGNITGNVGKVSLRDETELVRQRLREIIDQYVARRRRPAPI